MREGYAAVGSEFADAATEVSDLVGDAQKATVKSMVEATNGLMSRDELKTAVNAIKDGISVLQGDAILAGIAGALQAAARMAPAVVTGVGACLIALGPHLPLIGAAAGALGAMIYIFKQTKDQDKNIKVAMLWMESVKDWLMLVAHKVDRSGAASTVVLFEGLKDALFKMSSDIESFSTKWRITKMICSASFEGDFVMAKTAVVDLKNALRDFLDEETQQRQELQLANISSTQFEINEKLATMDDQLSQIRALLQQQADAQAAAAAVAATSADKEIHFHRQVHPEEEEIYINIQQGAGVAGDVPFKLFVLVFESFFYAGDDMPLEQRRGLKIAIKKDKSNVVSKAEWVKFYRHWTGSNTNMEMYLNKIASDNPTLANQAKGKALEAIESAKSALASKGIESVDDAKTLLKGKAASALSFGKNMGANLLGVGSGAKKAESSNQPAEVRAADTTTAPPHTTATTS